MNWSPQQDRARSIVSRWIRDPNAKQVLYLAGFAGTGKCLGIGTPVLMHDGSIRPVEQIQVGDMVMGPDSSPRCVISLARGQSKLYRVIPVKGEPWVCNEDHIMTLAGSKTVFYVGKTIDISVRELLKKWPEQPDAIWKLWRTAVDFPTAQQAIDPYWLGLWLGDGTTANTSITTMDTEVIAYCELTASRLGMSCKILDDGGKAVRVSLTGKRGKPGQNPLRNETRRCLDILGRKMIPREYLIADRAQRLAILAGIIDTDGHIDTGCVDLITVSEPLRDGILFLARSLGFAAYSRECTKRIKSLGFSGQYHRISISGDMAEIPCLVPHKKSPPRRQIKRTNVTGFSLEPLGPGDYYGFELDGDGRFLLGDFTVTHNSTLAKDLVSGDSKPWLFAAFTGKAAHVMATKGCTGARTIHSLIYKPAGEKNQEQILQLEAKLLKASAADRPAILQQLTALRKSRSPRWTLWDQGPLSDPDVAGVVVDEISMVSESLGRDLESFDKKILVLGDPAQLPPVMGGGYFTEREPDVMLTEIHRHARESDVLRLATHIREGGSLSGFPSAPNAQILFASTTDPADRAARALAADQVLVGLNATRHASNQRMRTLRSRTSRLPYAGDRLVCLRNDRELGIFNGSQWAVVNCVDAGADTATFSVRSEDDNRTVTSEAWLHHFQDRGAELTAMGQGQRDCAVFDWGYALTCHKAQGSQYPRVLVVDESRKLGGCEPRRWLSTAVSRAIDHVEVLT